ncbi:MAG: hypothetical protein M8872_11465 [marine benthic group bacterium]|jgi:predicted Zn-dependent peptidase|nr:hypothetical protein [Candidatus Benthicola marisminoris]MCL7982596.1 hypothetical protein [Gemmatimonadota bacterium]MCL7985863.1 hypothetical protein [Gemmatimonadota bacterium]
MSELHWTEIDRVKTVWADAPPPLRAGLLFRTGRIDETLLTAGHTHLIEHLALPSVGSSTQPQNGFVGGAATGFLTMGQSDRVVEFLSGVCRALSSPPFDRLDGEKQVLAAEEAARPYDFQSRLLTWRFGATGYGQLGMAELGIPRAEPEQLQEYASQRFTRENAVLWLSGPPPANLQLDLPKGEKQPLPPLACVQEEFPCWFVDDDCRGMAVGTIVPRVAASMPFLLIASKRINMQLRTSKAISYAPSVFYDHLTADTAHLVLYADSDSDRREELVDAFAQFFVGLGEVEESEVEMARDLIRDNWTGDLAPPAADRMIDDVQRAAMDWILGRKFETVESLAEEALTVSREDVTAFGRGLEPTAIFALPRGVPLQPCFGDRALASLGAEVQGRVVRSVDAPVNPERLAYGPEGVSVLFPDGSHCTVRYSELAAALYYDDGAVALVGHDAATVLIEPTLWRDGRHVCLQIREHVPSHRVVDERSRPADAIPRPMTTAWQRFQARLTGL